MVKKILKNSYLALILFFTYIPILVMVVLSFNASKSRVNFSGFSLKWYVQMFTDRNIVSALQNTVAIALLSSIIAVIIGTMAAVAICNMPRKMRNIYLGITNIPMLNADVATGISLMLCFITFGITLSFKTVLISHITFNIPYVILSVMPKLRGSSRLEYEAARDLGATSIQAFFKVVLPEIMPGIVSGFMLAVTMSLDDFIITHFTRGAGVNTISTLVYAEVRRGIEPSMYALSTIIFLIVLIILI
ncbi:MAG: ABC transporter permease, partial [Lachnospiraceae bacterium]|nr:ABC transporter permease [Lachnospiraceae bacterium]